MTTTITGRATSSRVEEGDSDITHIVCCCTNDTVGVCGWDCTNSRWSESDDDPVCAVCEALWPEGDPCPLCGCEEC